MEKKRRHTKNKKEADKRYIEGSMDMGEVESTWPAGVNGWLNIGVGDGEDSLPKLSIECKP